MIDKKRKINIGGYIVDGYALDSETEISWDSDEIIIEKGMSEYLMIVEMRGDENISLYEKLRRIIIKSYLDFKEINFENVTE